MQEILYLDTARLGQISPSAKRTLNAALELNKALGASAYFDDFFFGGVETLRSQNQFDGLSNWLGLERFKSEIKEYLFRSEDGKVVFASRTAYLMSLAAKMLFARCRNVLVTDLSWDPYRKIMRNSKSNKACKITEVKIRNQILNRNASAEEVKRLILESYCKNNCDGIFLPAVCNLGVALPVSEIMKTIRRQAKVRFSVVDAAQAINHVDLHWANKAVDFTFGGTHKWLRAYEPMVVGHFSRPSSQSFIQASINRELETNMMADSLLRLTHVDSSQNSETVNLCPLFAAAGALRDTVACTQLSAHDDSRAVVQGIAQEAGWEEIPLNSELRSRILLLKSRNFLQANAGELRKHLAHQGVAVTDYVGGICRISLPASISQSQARRLEAALKKN